MTIHIILGKRFLSDIVVEIFLAGQDTMAQTLAFQCLLLFVVLVFVCLKPQMVREVCGLRLPFPLLEGAIGSPIAASLPLALSHCW